MEKVVQLKKRKAKRQKKVKLRTQMSLQMGNLMTMMIVKKVRSRIQEQRNHL
jgi:hypothetical protein